MREKLQEEMFHDWLRNHQGILYKVMRTFTQSPVDQEDLFQEIALQLWKSIPSFRKEAKPSTWIYRVALNTSIAWQGRERKHGSTEFTGNVIVPSGEVEVDDRLEWLYAEIAQMNKIDRSMALLLLDGYSYREMSDILGISENNLAVRIHRIKKQLISKSVKYESHGI